MSPPSEFGTSIPRSRFVLVQRGEAGRRTEPGQVRARCGGERRGRVEPATAQPAPWGTRGARGSFQQRRGLASRFPVSLPRRPGHASSADGFSGEESWAAPVTVLRKRCSGGSLAGGAAPWAAGVAGEPAPAAGRDSRWVRKGFSCAPETPRRWAGRGLPVAPSGRHLPREVPLRAEHVTRVLVPSVLVTRGAWGENGLHAPPLANGAHCERSAARELGTAHSVSLASRARRPGDE